MWHEARKQEKKLRGLMVDYKKRSERRRNYYEMIVSGCHRRKHSITFPDIEAFKHREGDYYD